ncbi:Aste57867_21808 [Aphanomyces stellatus]|uniref:Aste57867_21808 protein n=1 Tax=Aphanomyces stellatus TaxID=120398 RepID=A0A485LIH2_9STRA|nr:hypothetical protein As57867_021739 [Aphanomyces stellatus]VFT98477.1 Aste57867_21808 [Aphanomyces stellatus]
MEASLPVASTFEKGDRAWHTAHVKLDDISGHLICFKEKQDARKWVLNIHGADISTPIPGAPTHGIATGAVPFCICIFTPETVVYLAPTDDAAKKAWTAALLRVATDGPQDAKFSKQESGDDFVFSARVSEFQVANGKAEYKVRCCARFLNRAYNRKMSTEWDMWHRYSSFASLDTELRRALVDHMKDIALAPRHIFHSMFGNPLDNAFLEERRVGLDSYIVKVCEHRTAVDFFHDHANPSLKTFFGFDSHCKQEDTQFTKKEGQSRQKETTRDKHHHHQHALPLATPEESNKVVSPPIVEAPSPKSPLQGSPKSKKKQDAPQPPSMPVEVDKATSPHKPVKGKKQAVETAPPLPKEEPVAAASPHKAAGKGKKGKKGKKEGGVRAPALASNDEPSSPVASTKAVGSPPARHNLLAQIQQGTALRKVDA